MQTASAATTATSANLNDYPGKVGLEARLTVASIDPTRAGAIIATIVKRVRSFWLVGATHAPKPPCKRRCCWSRGTTRCSLEWGSARPGGGLCQAWRLVSCAHRGSGEGDSFVRAGH